MNGVKEIWSDQFGHVVVLEGIDSQFSGYYYRVCMGFDTVELAKVDYPDAGVCLDKVYVWPANF